MIGAQAGRAAGLFLVGVPFAKTTIPDLRPGDYSYVIWSRGAENGHRGRLNVDPGAANWRLSVR